MYIWTSTHSKHIQNMTTFTTKATIWGLLCRHVQRRGELPWGVETMVILERCCNMLHQLQFSEHQELCLHGWLLSSAAAAMWEWTIQVKPSSAKTVSSCHFPFPYYTDGQNLPSGVAGDIYSVSSFTFWKMQTIYESNFLYVLGGVLSYHILLPSSSSFFWLDFFLYVCIKYF